LALPRHGPRPGRARSGGDTIAPRIRQTRTVASQIWPRRQTIKAQSAGAAARGVAPGGPTVDDLPMTRPRRHAAGLTGAGRALLKLGLILLAAAPALSQEPARAPVPPPAPAPAQAPA